MTMGSDRGEPDGQPDEVAGSEVWGELAASEPAPRGRLRKAFRLFSEQAERIYFNVTHPLRRARAYAQWRLFPGSLARCAACGRHAAEWYYEPAGHERAFCDDCVPRGCECNIMDSNITGEVVVEPPNAEGVQLVWTDFGGIEPEHEAAA
jgi:hypothetical protein